ncbi:hypothetical protein COCMIDRAFT_27097 [Bipolaris oryzae ATCC 44560]|uniref:Uncharacterized protein n=1 Tax=Bipolaris oryzae ATCC 44560 TaxID=930090 RepID=W6Z4A7_COCMI|nr:uncharacterized protein COCMIDRAFT_27097 [Bipolaris oryzae ATCC 44560]EUC44578.1 hypothetical protein COCMIDRAFT_27097 [Bipolaris oryzae ATCC 44560]
MGLASRIRLRFRGHVHVVGVVVRCGGDDEHSPPFAGGGGGGAKLGAACPIRVVEEITCASPIRNGWPLVNASHPLRAGVVMVVCPRIQCSRDPTRLQGAGRSSEGLAERFTASSFDVQHPRHRSCQARAGARDTCQTLQTHADCPFACRQPTTRVAHRSPVPATHKHTTPGQDTLTVYVEHPDCARHHRQLAG